MGQQPRYLKIVLLLLIVIPTALVTGMAYEHIVLAPICGHYGEAMGWDFLYFSSGGKVGSPQCFYQVEDPTNQTSDKKGIRVFQSPFSAGEKILFVLDRFVYLGGVLIGGLFVSLLKPIIGNLFASLFKPIKRKRYHNRTRNKKSV